MVSNETFPFEMSVIAVLRIFSSKYYLMRRFEMKRDVWKHGREREQDMSRRLIYHCRDDIKLNTKRTTGIQHVQNVIIIVLLFLLMLLLQKNSKVIELVFYEHTSSLTFDRSKPD